jgi:predicted site-specific integrase-resolvase
MKAKEALKVLGVTRISLYNYVKKGIIKVTTLKNGFYDYDNTSIYNFIGKFNRKNVIYARVSTFKQKNDLIRQVDYISSYCNNNNIHIDETFTEIESGITLDRPKFQKMLDEIINGKIQAVYVSYKDRLTRLSFMTLSSIFKRFNVQIFIVSDLLNKTGLKSDDNELYEDLLSMMHYFTTKKYSIRKNKNLYKNYIKK